MVHKGKHGGMSHFIIFPQLWLKSRLWQKAPVLVASSKWLRAGVWRKQEQSKFRRGMPTKDLLLLALEDGGDFKINMVSSLVFSRFNTSIRHVIFCMQSNGPGWGLSWSSVLAGCWVILLSVQLPPLGPTWRRKDREVSGHFVSWLYNLSPLHFIFQILPITSITSCYSGVKSQKYFHPFQWPFFPRTACLV